MEEIVKENKIYSCPYCKSILVVPKSCWQSTMNCTVCDKEMRLLDDEFDLAEIIEENEDGKLARKI